MRTRREGLRLLVLQLVGRAVSWAVPSPDGPCSDEARIVVIRPDHLGDLLLLTSALRLLRTMWPRAHISLMVGPWSTPFLAGSPDIDEVLSCDFPGFTRSRKSSLVGPYLKLWKTARRLRVRSYDLALVMRFDHWWGAVLTALSGVPRRVGYDVPECRPFLSHAVHYENGRHEAEQNLRLVRASGAHRATAADGAGVVQEFERETHPLRYCLQPADIEYAKAVWRDTDTSGRGPKVCIHPGAGAAVKRWAPDRFAAVGDALAREYGARILITGSEAETDLAWRVAAHMRSASAILAGRTKIGQLAALMDGADLVIGSDSGPLHLAVAVGASSVQLYGPSDPTLFGPWADGDRNLVVTSSAECAPCNRLDRCTNSSYPGSCMPAIPVGQVVAASRRALEAGESRRRGA